MLSFFIVSSFGYVPFLFVHIPCFAILCSGYLLFEYKNCFCFFFVELFPQLPFLDPVMDSPDDSCLARNINWKPTMGL